MSGRHKCTLTSTDTETFTCRKVVFLGPSTWLLRGWENSPFLRELADKVYVILLISKKLLKKASVSYSLHFPASFLLSVLHFCTYYSYAPQQRFCLWNGPFKGRKKALLWDRETKSFSCEYKKILFIKNGQILLVDFSSYVSYVYICIILSQIDIILMFSSYFSNVC